MQTVKQLLDQKSRNAVYSVAPDQMVIDALTLMAEKNIGAVLVMSEGALKGIFSERDYARKGILQGKKSKTTPVSEVMTPNVYTVRPDQTIEDCMRLMSEHKFRHLPVMDGGSVVGMASIGDIVSAIISDQQNRIESLEKYITGY